MLSCRFSAINAALLLTIVFGAAVYGRTTTLSSSTTTEATEENLVDNRPTPPSGCPPPHFPRCPPPPPGPPGPPRPPGPPGPHPRPFRPASPDPPPPGPHPHHPPHHHPPRFHARAPQFILDLNIGNLTAYFDIAKNFSLTKDEIKKFIETWLKTMPENVQEDYNAWQTNITQCKDEFVTKVKSNLSTSAAELFDLIEAVVDDEELTNPETCGQVLQVINNASLAAIDELHLRCFIHGHGHGPPPPPPMPGCHPHPSPHSSEQFSGEGPPEHFGPLSGEIGDLANLFQEH